MKTHQSNFLLGETLITPAAPNALSPGEALLALERHQRGDWGDVCEEDRSANERALQTGLRLFSVYHSAGRKFWIITEADRSATTILLPEDY